MSAANAAGVPSAAPVLEADRDRSLAATLQAWRERGAHRADPVRFRFIEALARRAEACEGAAHALLEDRVAGLLADLGKAVAPTTAAGPSAAGAAPAAVARPAAIGPPTAPAAPAALARGRLRPERGPLAELVDRIAVHAPSAASGSPTTADAVPGAAAPPELKALSAFRTTWSRLNADRRVTQSQAHVPENAGPLNTQRLVHRALVAMRELSPDYLQHFMAHVDALLALERMPTGGGAPGKEAAAR